MTVEPFSLKDAPALIERLLPVQKLSAEAYKERMAGGAQTLTTLGSYWKGRKPLFLAKACVLGCLLPAKSDPLRDLEVFEMLMGMDEMSFVVRAQRRPKPRDILGTLTIPCITDYFNVIPSGVLPPNAPVDWSQSDYDRVKIVWRDDISEAKRRQLEAQVLPLMPYNERVRISHRSEEISETHAHIWDEVNEHLGTDADTFPELIEQLGIMRFGHRPTLSDTFCGSGQIPFEAARLGCDVHASDLNPVACMLTWGAFNIIGGSPEYRNRLKIEQEELVKQVRHEIDQLRIETDGNGWRAKVYLYCIEVRCPQTGWMVPLLPSLIVSKGYRVIAELVPDADHKRYDIRIRSNVSDAEMATAQAGTIVRDGKYEEAQLLHYVDGVGYKTKISTIRGDRQLPDGSFSNDLRLWDKTDFIPRSDDILQERLYCVQWMRPKETGKGEEYEFRAVTSEDIERERIVEKFIETHICEWQQQGWIPDMRIEPGGPPRYEGLVLIRARGWRYWHHLFTARQLLLAGLLKKYQKNPFSLIMLMRALNINARLSVWHRSHGGGGSVQQVFNNQNLNVLFDYGSRAFDYLAPALLAEGLRSYPLSTNFVVKNQPADRIDVPADLSITDPPYGDAVRYDVILDFFIAWLRKNPPYEFSNWTWDSRRSLAITGEDEDFRRGMVAAYKRMTECMPDNGIRVIMFTHQSGSIWADMANIVWASGLQVTAAWYVATETDDYQREGSFVKGTVLLVCRKRLGQCKTSRDDLAWEIQEEVEKQVDSLVGLNQKAKGLYRDENVFEDADIQMAGYAAALRVLTRYSTIDGRDMTAEAVRPRVKGETTFVDSLIEFAVNTANQCLVPQGIEKRFWDRLGPAERFYLTMLDQESRGAKKLDNYQNFAKAFKVREFRDLMGSEKANSARLKSAVEFGRDEMNESSELYQSVLRAVLYGVMEIQQEVDGRDVLAHLTLNIPDYYGDMTLREMAAELAGYLAGRLEGTRPEEASAARVLRELVKNQRLG